MSFMKNNYVQAAFNTWFSCQDVIYLIHYSFLLAKYSSHPLKNTFGHL